MGAMTIGEVAAQAGVRTSTLRYYESIGLLAPPSRVGGQRRYDASVLHRLAVIRTAQRAGFTLDELRPLLDGIVDGDAAPAEWHDLIARKLVELDALLGNVRAMRAVLEDMLRCDDADLADCIVATGRRHANPV